MCNLKHYLSQNANMVYVFYQVCCLHCLELHFGWIMTDFFEAFSKNHWKGALKLCRSEGYKVTIYQSWRSQKTTALALTVEVCPRVCGLGLTRFKLIWKFDRGQLCSPLTYILYIYCKKRYVSPFNGSP